METHLYSRLAEFNKDIPNNYRERWGSALYYLEASHNVAGTRMDEVAIYNAYDRHQKQKAEENKLSRVSSASVTTLHKKNFQKNHSNLDKNIVRQRFEHNQRRSVQRNNTFVQNENKFRSQSNIAFGKHIFDFDKNKPQTAQGNKRQQYNISQRDAFNQQQCSRLARHQSGQGKVQDFSVEDPYRETSTAIDISKQQETSLKTSQNFFQPAVQLPFHTKSQTQFAFKSKSFQKNANNFLNSQTNIKHQRRSSFMAQPTGILGSQQLNQNSSETLYNRPQTQIVQQKHLAAQMKDGSWESQQIDLENTNVDSVGGAEVLNGRCRVSQSRLSMARNQLSQKLGGSDFEMSANSQTASNFMSQKNVQKKSWKHQQSKLSTQTQPLNNQTAIHYTMENCKRSVALVNNPPKKDVKKHERDQKALNIKNTQTTRLSSNFRGATNITNRKQSMAGRNETSKQILRVEMDHQKSVKRIRDNTRSQVYNTVYENAQEQAKGSMSQISGEDSLFTQDFGKQKRFEEESSLNLAAIGPRNAIQRALIQANEIDQQLGAQGDKGNNASSQGVSGIGDPLDRYNVIHQQTKEIYRQGIRRNREIASAKQREERLAILHRKRMNIEEEAVKEVPISKQKVINKLQQSGLPLYEQTNELKELIDNSELSEMAKIRKAFSQVAPLVYRDEGFKNPSDPIVQKMPQALRQLVEANNEQSIYGLMGLSREQYLKFVDIKKYMKNHKLDTTKLDDRIKNAEFSKEFFEIMDEDGGGVSAPELALPLIALGLATDTGFVKRVMKILAPKKFKDSDFENESLGMKEFSTLFRSDQTSEQIVETVKEEIRQGELNVLVNLYKKEAMKELEKKGQFCSMKKQRELTKAFNEQLIRIQNQEVEKVHEKQEIKSCLKAQGSYKDEPRQMFRNDSATTKDFVSTDLQNSEFKSFDHRNQLQQAHKSMIIEKVTTQESKYDNQQQAQSQIYASDEDISISLDPKSAVMKQKGFQQPLELSSQGAQDSTIVEVEPPKRMPKKAPYRMYDINDQVKIVEQWWNEIKPRNQIIKPMNQVAMKLVDKKLFIDPFASSEYLWKIIGERRTELDFSDFLSIFLKGFIKDVICGIALVVEKVSNSKTQASTKQQIDEFTNQAIKSAQEEKALLWKLAEYKRTQLLQLISKGMLDFNSKNFKQEKQKVVKRLIFDNLYNMKYKEDPDAWKNADYEEYLDGTIRLQKPFIDPYGVVLDEYSSNINMVGDPQINLSKLPDENGERPMSFYPKGPLQPQGDSSHSMNITDQQYLDNEDPQFQMYLKKQRKERFDTLKEFQKMATTKPKNMEDILEDMAKEEEINYQSSNDSARGPGILEPYEV